ncbi:MFS transporter [Roseomonas sp. BN140053]|uniref:MFS transporter n=1 Tax=Roseomonas sp. BN140053 TaxID=3391898 RepID=UPI0039EA7C93
MSGRTGTAVPSAPPPGAPPPAPPITLLRFVAYSLASLILGLTQGLGNNIVTANIQTVQATFGATTNEAVWLSAAYTSTSITASLLLYKFRTQFGLRIFAELGLGLFVVVSLAHFFAHDLRSVVALRAVVGFAAAPLSTLAFLYMLEVVPPDRKLTVGVALGLLGTQLSLPLARLISPGLLERGLWQELNLMELGLAVLSLGIVFLLPLTPPPRAKVFDRVDAISLPLLITGMALISIVFSLGRYYWWLEAPWLGVCLAAGIGALCLLVVIELNRAQPLIDLRWLSSTNMVIFGGSMLLVRFVLAEQTTGTIAFFQNLGLLNEHMAGMFWVILGATALGGIGVASVIKPANVPVIHATALLLIALGAWLESDATNLTRPPDVYLAQGLVALGSALFVPAAVSWGFTHTITSGMQYITSFFAVFLAAQNLGGLLGSSLLGTFLVVREKFHSSQIVENLTLDNPLVVGRIAQYGAAYNRVLGDATLRNAEGAATLAQVATREANVLAFNDLFLLVAIVAALSLLALLANLVLTRLRRPQSQPA